MGSDLGHNVPTARIRFPSFDLSSALKADNNARMAAEDAGELLEDGEIEFEGEDENEEGDKDEDQGEDENEDEDKGEEEDKDKGKEADKEACAEPAFTTNPSGSPPSSSRNNKKYAKLTKRSREKRATEAVERVASRGIKPFVVELAKGAQPIELEDFDASSLPVSSSGWNANPRKKLSPGLQRVWKNLDALSSLSGLKLLRWDGQSCIVLVDARDRIIAVLGGVPHGSKGKEWQAVEAEAAAAAIRCREASTFTEAQKHGRHGNFASRTVGYGYGNGRRKPQNYRVSSRANRNAMQELLRNKAIRRISGFQNALFNTFCHKNYIEYRDTNQEIQRKQPELQANFPNTAFAAATFNLGPLSFSPPHMDPDNRASSWCADTNMGPFDPDKGGHLVLWDLGLIIRFPPGSTILFPSALITHSTIPIQAHETRYAMIQYSSGGLFRWRNNGFQPDKSFLEKATAEERAEREAARASRWRLGLQKFTRWADLCRGDWRGTVRTAAGLDEVSDLSDLEESSETLHPSKRARRQ